GRQPDPAVEQVPGQGEGGGDVEHRRGVRRRQDVLDVLRDQPGGRHELPGILDGADAGRPLVIVGGLAVVSLPPGLAAAAFAVCGQVNGRGVGDWLPGVGDLQADIGHSVLAAGDSPNPRGGAVGGRGGGPAVLAEAPGGQCLRGGSVVPLVVQQG